MQETIMLISASGARSSKSLGFLQLGFENVVRTLLMAWTQEAVLVLVFRPVYPARKMLFIIGSIDQPKLQLNLSANYYLLTNYPYFYNYYLAAPESVHNVLIVSANKDLP